MGGAEAEKPSKKEKLAPMNISRHDIQVTADATGGDDACWLHLVCPSCGALVTAEDRHREGCDAREPEAKANDLRSK
jgi:hypothetical protein